MSQRFEVADLDGFQRTHIVKSVIGGGSDIGKRDGSQLVTRVGIRAERHSAGIGGVGKRRGRERIETVETVIPHGGDAVVDIIAGNRAVQKMLVAQTDVIELRLAGDVALNILGESVPAK